MQYNRKDIKNLERQLRQDEEKSDQEERNFRIHLKHIEKILKKKNKK